MLNSGGDVVWQSNVQVETLKPLQVFSLARFKGTQELNNAFASGSLIQDANKQYFLCKQMLEK